MTRSLCMTNPCAKPAPSGDCSPVWNGYTSYVLSCVSCTLPNHLLTHPLPSYPPPLLLLACSSSRSRLVAPTATPPHPWPVAQTAASWPPLCLPWQASPAAAAARVTRTPACLASTPTTQRSTWSRSRNSSSYGSGPRVSRQGGYITWAMGYAMVRRTCRCSRTSTYHIYQPSCW